MIPDFIGWVNQPLPGSPDPQFARLLIVLCIMAIACLTAREAVASWSTWARKVKREKQQLIALLVVNGLALVAAAMRDDPIRVITALLALTFAAIAVSLFIRFKNDGSTAPVYPQLYPSSLFRRFR